MNSEGCKFARPSESQRRAPLTSRPNPGTSSRTRSATPSTNSHGAARCHSRMGTWNTSMPATTLVAKNSACRSRKYPDFPSVNLLASASAIEAEYTITIPKVSSRSDAHSTPLSYSAGSERPGLTLLSIDDSLHGLAERFAAVPVIAEHVEARAGGRKQHRVARTRRLRGEAHRFLHACGAADRNACSGDSGFDQRRVAADQNECAHRSRDRVFERREVLPLAVAAGDENDLRITARESSQGCDRRADVGALGVVVPAHPGRLADPLDAMRESLELAKRREQGLERQAERAAKRERRERVGGVVQADKLHFADREEQVCALREPGLAAALDETPVLGAPWDVESESDRLSSGQRHRQAARVAPVEDLDAVSRKYPRLGAVVVVEAAVAVQMVFGDVKDRGGGGGKRVCRLELEARELQHPQARGPSQLLAAHERIEHRRADIAGDLAVGPRGFRHRAGKRRDGALAVGARHRDDPRSPLRHRQARVTQTGHQRLSARATHRSFKVDRPNSTSIRVMIQKRTTT